MMTFIQAEPAFPYLGEIASIGAALIWSLSITLYAKYGKQVDGVMLNVNKNLVAGICLIVTALCTQVPLPHLGGEVLILGLSGVIGIALGDTLFFAALLRIGANLTSALQCLAPLIAALLAVLFLGENMNQLEIFGMVLTSAAVTGVVLLHRHEDSSNTLGSRRGFIGGIALALASAVLHALGIVMSRQALQSIDIVYGTLARLIPALVFLFLWHQRATPTESEKVPIWATRKQGAMLTLAAFLGTYLGLVLMSLSTKYTKAGTGTALSSTYPIWVIPVSRILINERSSWVAIFGTVLGVIGIAIMVAGSSAAQG